MSNTMTTPATDHAASRFRFVPLEPVRARYKVILPVAVYEGDVWRVTLDSLSEARAWVAMSEREAVTT